MPKQLKFDEEARSALLRGINTMAAAVRATLGPKGRNVVIDKKFGSPTITKDGVTVAKEKPQEGKVVAVGKGKVTEDGKLQPLDVKKGDRVLFNKYSGTEVNVDGEEHLIIREEDVLAILD